MNNTYFELFFRVNENLKEAFIELVFELGIDAVEEKDGGVYVRLETELDGLCLALSEFAKGLEQAGLSPDLSLSLSQKDNKNWIEEYKKGIQPILIDNIYIHTTWQEPKSNALNIIIDPALAFGSGHHESTHSCLKLLQQYAKKDLFALDLGCGSGILAIALAKLGCKVQICDTDELAVQSALSNARLNSVEFNKAWVGSINGGKDFRLEKNQANLKNNTSPTNTNISDIQNKDFSQADFSNFASSLSQDISPNLNEVGKFDLIVANIIADVILILARDFKNHLKDNAILILSGILEKYESRIKETFSDLSLVKTLKNGEWLSFVYKNKGKK